MPLGSAALDLGLAGRYPSKATLVVPSYTFGVPFPSVASLDKNMNGVLEEEETNADEETSIKSQGILEVGVYNETGAPLEGISVVILVRFVRCTGHRNGDLLSKRRHGQGTATLFVCCAGRCEVGPSRRPRVHGAAKCDGWS